MWFPDLWEVNSLTLLLNVFSELLRPVWALGAIQAGCVRLLPRPLQFTCLQMAPGDRRVAVSRFLTGVWRCPPGCLAPSASFSTGHSLSGGLGAPHISALSHSLHLSPSSSPKELSGFWGKPSPSRASLFYSRCLSQTFSECLASTGSLRRWSTKAYKKLFFLCFTPCHSHFKSL